MSKLKQRAVFISDIHLGTRDAQSEYLLDFLRHTECEYLYLLGDIIDIWKLRSGWYWPQLNNDLLQLVFKKARSGTQVIYIPGNHDEMFRNYVGSNFNGVQIQQDAVHITADGRRLLLIHGDEFDSVVTNNRWLAHLGSWGYDVLLWLNRHFNSIRRHLGFPYWSLSHYLKHRVKNAVSYINSFEQALVREAGQRGVDGIVCGHIHHAAIEDIKGICYANSGDWVESCTALLENDRGELRIVHWLEESATLLDEYGEWKSGRETSPRSAAYELQDQPLANYISELSEVAVND
ncbi:Ser/Thr protein phosphatase family protein, UDP-2,3-diacylglucosamine hydrolase homolog [hydrothermal vent metagenome]|uniref:Ser/Thr protein phosphatase family protein, UDP-2,3-diacylglucosamine hydrolase homolog n=1 Tax=hydrothermal vent metagenome TaxID=652676 RepID=A0A3B1B8A6_9ZZZZ